MCPYPQGGVIIMGQAMQGALCIDNAVIFLQFMRRSQRVTVWAYMLASLRRGAPGACSAVRQGRDPSKLLES